MMQEEDGTFSKSYIAIMIFIFSLHRAVLLSLFLSLMAFYTKISDPVVGGTYMTFLNTLGNLAFMWAESFSLWFIGLFTTK